ncbi:MAG TPA: SNF2-related protein [Anaerolineales bacterium]|nr:SNF2-related protein [Anaerolineales bacterium]
MPPVRKATGQAVSPLRRPSIAGVKELRFRPAAISLFPLPPGLALHAEDSGDGLPARLGPPDYAGIILGRIEPPKQLSLPVVFSETGAFAPWSMHLDAPLEGTLARLGPAGSESARGPQPAWWRAVLPHLLAPALETDVAAGLGARPHHQDGAQALIANPRFLLADDLGTGKARAVCLALAVLVQQREIRRILLIVPRERLADWDAELATFLPELARREIAGNSSQRRDLWDRGESIQLVSPGDLAEDLDAGLRLPAFDVIVIDFFIALMRRQAAALRRICVLEAPRRWALAGAVPVDPEDWRSLLNFLAPDTTSGPGRPGTGELRERFTRNVLRRSKTELARQMPRLSRHEVWVDLDDGLQRLYDQALTLERQRLARLGSAFSRTHLQGSIDQLKQVVNFAPDSYDGPKVRALVDLAEEIAAGRSKLVVFTTYGDATAARLQPALDAYGVVRLSAADAPDMQATALARFRYDAGRRVLLADTEAKGDGKSLDPATFVVHFDHNWNPAHRRRLEQRFFPDLGPGLPLTIYELWVRRTIEERYHRALETRHLLASHLPQDTQPADLDERVSLEDWRSEVFEIGVSPPPTAQPVRRTGPLPGTGTLRSRLDTLSAEQLAAAVEGMLAGLGFSSTRRLTPAEVVGLTLLACRAGETDCRLVRCLRTGRNIGVQEARALLEEADARPDCRGALLLVTTEFTPACKKLAEDSHGRLRLFSGEDLYGSFRQMGIVP